MARVRERITAALSKIETTVGTDSSPGVGDFFRIITGSGFSWNPEVDDSDEFKGGLGAGEHVVGGVLPAITLINNVRGSGVANTPPETASLMLACGMEETIAAAIAAATAASGTTETITAPVGSWPASTAAGQFLIGHPCILGGTLPAPYTGLSVVDFITEYTVSGGNMTIRFGHTYPITLGSGATVSAPQRVVYKSWTPTPTAFPATTIYAYLDIILQKFVGCRGTMSQSWAAKRKATQQFDMQGVDGGDSDTAIITGVTDDPTSPPRWKNGILSINRKSMCASTLTWALNQTGVFPECPTSPDGFDTYEINGRRFSLTVNPDLNQIATQGSYKSILKANTIMPVCALLGDRFTAAVGNRIGLCVPQAKLRNVTPGVRNGFRDNTLEFGSVLSDYEVVYSIF